MFRVRPQFAGSSGYGFWVLGFITLGLGLDSGLLLGFTADDRSSRQQVGVRIRVTNLNSHYRGKLVSFAQRPVIFDLDL